MTKNAIAYLRKSTNVKDKQVLSLESQQHEVEIAKKRAEDYFGEPVEIIEEYIEKISGTDSHRPEFQQMCARFTSGDADILLTWKIDRLSRNHSDSHLLMMALMDGRIPLIQDSSRLWTKRDTGLNMHIAAGLAIEESMQIAERSKAGTETLMRKGGVPFRPPFGAKNNKDRGAKLEERVYNDPVESRFAKKMFEKRIEGSSFRDIGEWLAKNGFKNSNGSNYSASTIKQWIQNTFYYGVCEWGGHTWKHIYEPIIEKELWDRANSVGRGNTPRLKKDSFPLKGMVKSAISGRPLTASFAKKIYPQYHTHGRWKKDDNVSISEAKILEYFGEECPFYHVPEVARPYIMEAIRDFHKNQLEELEVERNFLTGEITKNANKLDGLIDMRVNGELTAEQFSKKQKEYVENGVDLERKLSKILKIDNAILTSITEAVELLTNLNGFWKTADDNKKCQIIKMIAVELYIDEEKTLYIKENAVFEALRELNCTKWLSFQSNGRTQEMDVSPLTKLARHFIENEQIVKTISNTLSF